MVIYIKGKLIEYNPQKSTISAIVDNEQKTFTDVESIIEVKEDSFSFIYRDAR